jgi:arylsulfatase A-like enzyme
MTSFARLLAAALLASTAFAAHAQTPAPAAPKPRHNVILFVADGLRRNSVTPEDMPTLYRIRTEGVDLHNSHSVFPTVTTANASVIATGHGLGDTGDFGNVIYPGALLAEPGVPTAKGSIAPFLESDDVLATLNGFYNGNYIAETTLLAAAHAAGFSVASIGKLGPTSIQQIASVNRNQLGEMVVPDTIIIDDSTGYPGGIPLPLDFHTELSHSKLPDQAPQRTNGYAPTSQWSNGFSGDAKTPGTLAANNVQIQWFADVTTQLVLPDFAAANKPFVLLFWSRDPDGSQHNQGDSFQTLTPGINGDTSRAALRNADHALAQIVDWLDKHPAIKATTDILVTSDHGFATISRREVDAEGTLASDPAAALTYVPQGKDKAQPPHTLPTGFLAIDLALLTNQHLFDPAVRATTGDSVYEEVQLNADASHYPEDASALIGQKVTKLDGSDARLLIEANGGTDYIFVPSKDPAIVAETIDTLSQLDYIAGIFVDDAFCPTATSCPGALPISSVGLKGASKVPMPTIAVSMKTFYLKPGDMQSGILLADTNLQEGQGNHGSLSRSQSWNNMAAIGPDFKKGFVDPDPVGNIDITPTVASILGIKIPSIGSIKGRVMSEALTNAIALPPAPGKTLISAPAANGRRTVLDYQEQDGARYYDRSCLIPGDHPACIE